MVGAGGWEGERNGVEKEREKGWEKEKERERWVGWGMVKTDRKSVV